MKNKQLISEVRQLQKIAGIPTKPLDVSWNPYEKEEEDEEEDDFNYGDDEDPDAPYDDTGEYPPGGFLENDDYDESSDSESDDTDAMGGINEASVYT